MACGVRFAAGDPARAAWGAGFAPPPTPKDPPPDNNARPIKDAALNNGRVHGAAGNWGSGVARGAVAKTRPPTPPGEGPGASLLGAGIGGMGVGNVGVGVGGGGRDHRRPRGAAGSPARPTRRPAKLQREKHQNWRWVSVASIAQLGERKTEDLEVPGSIPGLGIVFRRTFPASAESSWG